MILVSYIVNYVTLLAMLTMLIMFRFHVTNQNAFLRACSKIFSKVDIFDIWLFFVISWL